jgi:BirA family transcriptional regulator, biotin operon repressor / biotin---[acetyl-CoA-carboxylase] ligase
MRNHASIEVVTQTGSTNSDLLQRETLGAQPVLRIAWHQTDGRGTRGKPWVSHVNDSLTFSLGWCQSLPSVPLACWSIVVGLVVCQRLAQLPGSRPLSVKWPNDLVSVEKVSANINLESEFTALSVSKVAGILVETRLQGDQLRLVTGIGLNLQVPRLAPLPTANQESPNSIAAAPLPVGAIYAQATPAQLANAAKQVLAQDLAEDLLAAWRQFELSGFASFVGLLDRFDVLKDQSVNWREVDGGLIQHGHCLGVDQHGLLVVQAPGMPVQRLNSASAQVRLT